VRMHATSSQICPVYSLRRYIEKRNPLCSAFFQRPKDSFSESDAVWFENRPLGKNKLGRMMTDLSSNAGLSQVYTNHCIRATTITALSNAGFEARHIMTVSGHRNEASVRSYVKDTTSDQKRSMSATLSKLTTDEPVDLFSDGLDDMLCLSTSQTERFLEDIADFENKENNPNNAANGKCEPQKQEVRTGTVSIAKYDNNVQIATKGPSPTFNFHGCNVKIQYY